MWRSRHKGIVILLWLHVLGLAIYGLISTRFAVLHVAAEIAALIVMAALAGWPRLNRELRTVIASMGLITCSGLLVHYSGGVIEMHFHFFVMVAVITLYQTWAPFLVAILFVALHHGIVGVLDPTSVYNHRDAWLHPWKWAGIHAAFVLAASFAGITTWRLNEALRSRVEALNAQLEQRVKERTAELEAANRKLDATNKELEAFSYSVSHDLRAPLRSIDGFSQILAEEYDGVLDTKAQQYLQRVRNASGRMASLIDGLLDLAQVTRGELSRELVDVSRMAGRIATDLHQHEPERKVDFDIQTGIQVIGDRRLLGALLENLLGNAWKFTSKHVSASIEVGQAEIDGQPVLFVRDDGAGFESTYRDKLFRPFSRLHDAGQFEGTGIGLATVERIVARHGGRIWAESAPERGATFYLALPDSLLPRSANGAALVADIVEQHVLA